MTRKKKRQKQFSTPPQIDEADLSQLEWLPWAAPFGVSILVIEVMSGGTRHNSVHELVDKARRLEGHTAALAPIDDAEALAERNLRVLNLWGAPSSEGVVQRMIEAGFLRRGPDVAFVVDPTVSLSDMLDLNNRADRQKALMQLRLEW